MGKLGRLSTQLTEGVPAIPKAKTVRQGQILPSENLRGGFMGEIGKAFKHPETVWNAFFRLVLANVDDVYSEGVRKFLDSPAAVRTANALINATNPNYPERYYDQGELPLDIPNDLERKIKTMLFGDPWGRDYIQQFMWKLGAGPAEGNSLKEIETALSKLVGAVESAKEEERKKNWKERDAAMHDVQKAADQLLTTSRAWMAQRR